MGNFPIRTFSLVSVSVCLLLTWPSVTAAQKREQPWFRDATKEYGSIDGGRPAFADINGDGFLDLVPGGRVWINTLGKHPAVGKRYYLKARLESLRKSNRLGIGSRVVVKVGDNTFARQVETGTGSGCQNDLALHSGIGDPEGPAEVTVYWAGGGQSTHRAELNQTVVLRRK